MKRRTWFWIALLAAGLVASGPLLPLGAAAHASAPESGADAAALDLCRPALLAAEREEGTPPGLLERIARVESGRLTDGERTPRPWPWTVDAGGAGAFYATKADAVAAVRKAQTLGVGSIDVGCMQVDLQMHPGAFRSLEEAFDPAANADYAARYLRQLHAEAWGDWDVAVGLYHSHTPEIAAAYRDRVAGIGHGLLSGIGGPEPLYLRLMRQGRMRLPTAGGGVLLVNAGRQPRGLGRPRATACEVAAAFAPDMAVPFRVRGCRTASR